MNYWHGTGRGFKLDREYLTGKQSRKKRKREKRGLTYNGKHPLALRDLLRARSSDLRRAKADAAWIAKAEPN